jgi:hypothetical protein
VEVPVVRPWAHAWEGADPAASLALEEKQSDFIEMFGEEDKLVYDWDICVGAVI